MLVCAALLLSRNPQEQDIIGLNLEEDSPERHEFA